MDSFINEDYRQRGNKVAMKFVLTIAGSDPSGGAGIQSDLATFSQLGLGGRAVVTAVTAQNERRFLSVNPVSSSVLRDQLLAVEETPIHAVKIGMLGTKENIQIVARFLGKKKKLPVVLDPIYQASTGAVLLEEEGWAVLPRILFPYCTLVTPNLKEASLLTSDSCQTIPEMERAAVKIFQGSPGLKAVLIKGGHLKGEATDLLYTGKRFLLFTQIRKAPDDVHGTGCVLSAAIAASLADGHSLIKSVEKGKSWVTRYIRKRSRASSSR